MEHAAYVTKLNELTNIETDFSRVYFGNEFCERLLPSLEDIEKTIDYASKKGMQFTFVTPYVTNRGITKLKNVFSFLEKLGQQVEVVFNDYGVLRILVNEYKNLRPVMGRLLNKMKRGPRLINLVQTLPETTLRYLRSSCLDVPAFNRFLLRNGIRRVELDNLLQGIDLDVAMSGVSASLYVPYAYVTTTRACLAIDCEVHGKEDVAGVFPCNKECQKYTFYLKSRYMPVILIRKGNTVFLKNESVPGNLEKKGVDRIVHELGLPL